MHASTRRGRKGVGTGPAAGVGLHTSIGPDISDKSVADRVADLSLTVANLTPQVEAEIRQLLDEVLVHGQFAENAFQVVAYACALEKEKDARLLDLILDLTFRELVDNLSVDVYHCARLCRILATEILPTMQDGKTLGPDGTPMFGPGLFRAYLLDRCKSAVNQAWEAKELAVSHSDKLPVGSATAQVPVTRWLNILEFIRTIWGNYTLEETILHFAIDKGLASTKPGDLEIHKLLAIIGQGTRFSRESKMKDRMDAHYSRLRELVQSNAVAPEVHESILTSIPNTNLASMTADSRVLPTRLHGLTKAATQSHPLVPDPVKAGAVYTHERPANIIAQAPKAGVSQASDSQRPDASNFDPAFFKDGKFQVTATTPLTWVVTFFTQFADTPVKDYTSELKAASFSPPELIPVKSSQLSDVYRATLSTGVSIAVKCVRSAISGSSNIIKHTVTELDAWSRLRHANVLELLGIALFNGRLAMISQWMDNGSIISVINAQPELDRFALCLQVVDVVTWLHEQKLIHGDLKGANILMSENNTPKLTDFGLSITQQGVLDYSTTFQGGGTAKWMAPELMKEDPARTYKTDIYALGMTILEILTGKEPFEEIQNTLEVIHAVRVEKRIPRRPQYLSESTHRNKLFWTAMCQCWAYDADQRPGAGDILKILSDAIQNKDGGSKDNKQRNSYCCTFA